MFQIVVVRRLQGRGIFVTEDRNEPNTELTPLPDGTKEERPVILGRKLAAKERRTLLETRNKIKQDFQGNECHISPTTKGGGKIEGPCMHCPICFTYGGLLSGGGGGNYGRAAIVLYDDAFSLGDSDVETLTANSVDTKTQRTGTALMSETFVYGGTFVNVISVRSDILEILNLVLDGIVSTDSYGARSKYYGRMKNEISLIIKTDRPLVTSYELTGMIGSPENLQKVLEQLKRDIVSKGATVLEMPKLGNREEVIKAADNSPDVQSWYQEVNKYLHGTKKE